MSYIILNFQHGYGSFLGCLEYVAKNNLSDHGIIIPLVYGDEQKRIIHESYPDLDVFYSRELGELLNQVIYHGGDFCVYLCDWLRKRERVEKQIKGLLEAHVNVVDHSGRCKIIHPRDIIMEVSRNPRVRYLSLYCNRIDYSSSLLSSVYFKYKKRLGATGDIYTKVLEESLIASVQIECNRLLVFDTPEKTRLVRGSCDLDIKPGVYVSVSGIGNVPLQYKSLVNLYSICANDNLRIYTNNTDKIFHLGTKAPVDCLWHPNIKFVIGRAGWGIIKKSVQGWKPFIALPFNQEDDPEIFYNIQEMRELKLGRAWDGQDRDILKTK